jgi:predicted glycosyltransferase
MITSEEQARAAHRLAALGIPARLAECKVRAQALALVLAMALALARAHIPEQVQG